MLTLGPDDFLHSSMKNHFNMASPMCPSQYPRFSPGRGTLLDAFLLRKSALQCPVIAFLYSALAWVPLSDQKLLYSCISPVFSFTLLAIIGPEPGPFFL